MRTLIAPTNGQSIPTTANERPLIRMGKPIRNGNGRLIIDDEWVYVNDGYGAYAINTIRAQYVEKMALAQVTIAESIGNKLMDAELKKFVEQVSDNLVFEKYGKWYRVYLYRKTRRTFGVKKVQLYTWTIAPNRKFDGMFSYELAIDWKNKFYVR